MSLGVIRTVSSETRPQKIEASDNQLFKTVNVQQLSFGINYLTNSNSGNMLQQKKKKPRRPQRRIFVWLSVGHYCQAILLFRGLVNALVDPSLPHFSPELLKFKNSKGYKYLVIPVSIGIPT